MNTGLPKTSPLRNKGVIRLRVIEADACSFAKIG